MPFVDQRAGNCYVWTITSFLFICIVAGGLFLGLYMTQPETPSTAWYPIAGVTLICLPWLFWFLTFLYCILSRAFGFRMDFWGATYDHPGAGGSVSRRSGGIEQGDAAGSNAGGATSQGSSATKSASVESGQGKDGGKHVHFGAAVVVDGIESSSRSSNSKESELPLKLSMASRS